MAGSVPRYQPEIGANFRGIPGFLPRAGFAASQAFLELGQSLDKIADTAFKAAEKKTADDAYRVGLQAGSGYQAPPVAPEPVKAETKLTEEQEVQFKQWLKDQKDQGYIGEGDYRHYQEKGYGADYDFRLAWAQGLKGEKADDGLIHWPDTGKKPNHPTFSVESAYAKQYPKLAGRWENGQYVKPSVNVGRLVLPDDLTVASQHYRKGAIEGFEAQFRLSQNEAFTRIAEQYSDDPVQLEQHLRTWVEGATGQLPVEVKTPMMAMAVPQVNSMVAKSKAAWADMQYRKNQESLTAAYNLALDQVEVFGFPKTDEERQAQAVVITQGLDAINKLDLTESEKQRMRFTLSQKAKVSTTKAFEEEIEAHVLNGYVQAQDPVGYITAFMRQTPEQLGLTGGLEQKNKLLNSMQAAEEDKEWLASKTAVEEDFAEQLTRALSQKDIEEKIEVGDPSVGESTLIDFVRKNPKVTPDWVATQLAGLKKKRAQDLKEQGEINQVIDALQHKKPLYLDPKDEADKRVIDKVWEKMGQEQLTGWPVAGHITSRFKEDRGTHTHKGVDIGAVKGASVIQKVSGKVAHVGFDPKGYGRYVDVVQVDGKTLRYGHLDTVAVKVGDDVPLGGKVGTVGSTGNSTGPHTHIEVRDEFGHLIDPQVYFARSQRHPITHKDKMIQAIQFVNQLKVVPDGLVSDLRRAMHSGDKDMITNGVRVMAAIIDKEPELTHGFDDKELLTMHKMVHYTRQGYTPQEALGQAKKDLNPEMQSQRAARKSEFDALLKKQENQARQVFKTKGVFGFGATPHPVQAGLEGRLEATYNEAFKNAMLNGSNEGEARDFAVNRVKKTFDVSYVTGQGQVMQYPPERYYAVGGDATWLKDDLSQALKGKYLRPLGAHEVKLVADRRTAREASENNPSYLVMIKDQYGQWVNAGEGDKVLRWIPDLKGYKAKKSGERGQKVKQLLNQRFAASQFLPKVP